MKKITLTLMIFSIIINLFIVPAAYSVSDTEREIDLVSSLGIINGYPDGTFGLENFVSRAEFTKIAVSSSEYRNSVAANLTVSPFHDVKYTHWAAPYIKIASTNKLVTGYSDSTFKPDNTVTYEEAITVALRLLGYTDDDFGSSWPYGQVGIADKIGLSKNMNSEIGAELTREKVVTLVFNLLNTKNKNSNSYFIENLDYQIVEDAILIASSNEDTSVGSDKVYTSSGTYKISTGFNYDDVGKKGDMVIKDGDTLIMFFPNEQQIEQYSIYQALDDSLIAYSGGSMSTVDVDNSIAVYNKSNKTTLAALMQSIATGDILTLYKNSSGVVDYALLKTENLTGPITVKSKTWYETENINTSDIIVMRDGVKSSLSSIQLYDIAYYSKELNTVWAYSKKITGIYENATPNKDSLTSVTVSGNSYEIESASAFNALSSSGSFGFGDTVTLLIGRNGKVADVMPNSSASSEVLYGFLTGTGTKEFTDSDGNSYTSFYADVVLPDGEKYQYAAKRIYSSNINNVVKVTFSDGVAVLSAYNATNQKLSGEVDAAASMIGNYKIASDVEILDVAATTSTEPTAYTSVFLKRLDGINLLSSKVAYAGKNSNGEYNKIILRDVTGDVYDYGIVISADSDKQSGKISGRYTFDINGTQSSVSTQNSAYSIYSGQPARFLMNKNNPSSVTPLEKLSGKVASVKANILKTQSGVEYKISDKAVVYHKNNEYKYTIMPIKDLEDNTEYKLTAYYDKSEKHGGRIRIIIAEDK